MACYVVTGGASGIGAEVVAGLLEGGHTVYSLDRHAHPTARHVQVDLSDAGSIETAVERLPEVLDGLVHVAGVTGTADPRQVLAVNLLAPRRLTALLLGRLRPGAAVVTVASIAALRSSLPDQEVAGLLQKDDAELLTWLKGAELSGADTYDTCKKLLVVWTAALAGHLVPLRVRAASVSPGPVQTPLLTDFRSSMGTSVDDAERALGRHGDPGEVAAAVLFLLSASASWCNGIDLRVDGGLVALRTAAGMPELVGAAPSSGGEPVPHVGTRAPVPGVSR
ncbi:MAG: SDR family oxidoreductase [Mycobacteriales bacterium]